MNNKKTIYRTTLMSRLTWIVILICCVAFIGCPVAEEMTADVLQPTSTDDEGDTTTDPNVDPNTQTDTEGDTTTDPNVDPNVDPLQ
jgi:hypothetical protein